MYENKNYPYATILSKHPYLKPIISLKSHFLGRMLGFQYPLEKDEVDVLLRGRIIFNEAQTQWRVNCVEKGIKIKDDQLCNMNTGGD